PQRRTSNVTCPLRSAATSIRTAVRVKENRGQERSLTVPVRLSFHGVFSETLVKDFGHTADKRAVSRPTRARSRAGQDRAGDPGDQKSDAGHIRDAPHVAIESGENLQVHRAHRGAARL